MGSNRVVCGEAVVGREAQPRLVNSAREFEAQIMKELIRPMTRPDEDDNGTGSEGALNDFAGEILGQSLSRAGGFGIASRIIGNLSQTERSCSPDSGIGISRDLKAARLK